MPDAPAAALCFGGGEDFLNQGPSLPVFTPMDQLISDIRSGLRMLLKYPMLSSVAILTLGLGLGLSTTVFCVVNGGLFKGLPFPDAGRIVSLVETNPAQNEPRLALSAQDFAVWRERQTSFERLGPFAFAPVNLSTEEGRPERWSGALLSVEAFNVIGVQPILGRGFRDGDDRPGAEPVMLLGYDVWHDRYGGAATIVGRAIRANGVQRTVIGVMPEKFAFPIRESIWMPLARFSKRITSGLSASNSELSNSWRFKS